MRIITKGFSRSLLTLLLLGVVATEAAVQRGDCRGRHLKFNIGIYDPVGASESSRFSPTRQPIEEDRYVARKLDTGKFDSCWKNYKRRSIRPPDSRVDTFPLFPSQPMNHLDNYQANIVLGDTYSTEYCLIMHFRSLL